MHPEEKMDFLSIACFPEQASDFKALGHVPAKVEEMAVAQHHKPSTEYP